MIDAFGGSARYNVEAAVMDNVAQSSSGGLRNYNRGYLDAENDGCQPDKLTVYKVILHTFWSRDKFPKHYPDWSPSAQWSKVFGRCIDNYKFFVFMINILLKLDGIAQFVRVDIICQNQVQSSIARSVQYSVKLQQMVVIFF